MAQPPIDGEVCSHDLPRDVARQEQAGVGDVGVKGDALEGVLGGMPLGRLLDA
jgi:hypothetical protein